ncbi:1-phosphatidylinositol 4,5-bisphosphate phosphodiesterase epsilon-1-like [Tachyglossus aculeatus]|uniref:1-phosphatidylinositol 4,5-bisphosphate phosphodiesterase epsilon-1-like n=1 Tax=Tachyglossus aculeatus TaxID=9261 RepID=UPI0018F73577|nr:1-phosphatidylinositol 4,5-bisphosphate phosphodiesterase epsilon-1-like [Tachyglossus aculeatus]
MTSEEMAVSVVGPAAQGKAISFLPAAEENSKRASEPGVIKSHSAPPSKRTKGVASCLSRHRKEHLEDSLPKIFSMESEDGTRDSSTRKEERMPGSVGYLNINYNVLQTNRPSSVPPRSRICESCDSLAEENPRLETGIATSLERNLLTGLQLRVDGPSVEMNPLGVRSALQQSGSDDTDDLAVFHFHYTVERTISKSLCALHGNFIFDGCGSCVASPDAVDERNSNALANKCGSANGKPGCENCQCLDDQYFCLKRTSKKADMVCSGNFSGKMSSKVFVSHLDDCNEACEEEIEEDFCKNKKERSTLLIRRFCKNDREVKKSVHTGTRAIVRTLPSGHVGAEAWIYVNKKRNRSLKHCGITTEHPTEVHIRQDLNFCQAKSQWFQTFRYKARYVEPLAFVPNGYPRSSSNQDC